MIDPIATMTPAEYRTVKARLQEEGHWHGGAGTPAQERAANRRAEQVLAELRK